TALGPSLGGIGFWRYPSEHDAAVDVLRLSQAMSLKAAAAGLHQGGGKAVVLVDDPDAPRSDALLRAMGRAIDDLGGRYIAAEDVGATPHDMQVIASETPWVTGLEGPGGSGDPSPMTAYGVVQAMGGVLSEKTIPRLQCRAVCGAANNQLADSADDDALAGRGILYAPDFVVNAGGIINLAEEFAGYDRQRATKRTAQIADTVRRVFELVRTERV